MFSIQQPIKGLPYDRVAKLTNAINAEAQHLKGGEVVFQVSGAYQPHELRLRVPADRNLRAGLDGR